VCGVVWTVGEAGGGVARFLEPEISCYVSFSRTISGEYGISPVLLNADRIVVGLKVDARMDSIAFKNSTLSKSVQALLTVASTASV
jgi:hypothetical protein